MGRSVQFRQHGRFPWRDWLGISLLGLCGIAFVSMAQVHATVGWFDQTNFHWPTVYQFAKQLPFPDVVHATTSTGPAYHLCAAVLTRGLGLGMEGTQLVMGVLVWSTLAAALLAATEGLPVGTRNLVLGAVFASPYVLESTLWMLTDALALALSVLAFMRLMTLSGVNAANSYADALCCSIAIAAACAVRQTAAWLLPVAAVAIFVSRRKAVAKLTLTGLVAVAPLATLGSLFLLWRGFAPPGMDEIARGPEPLAIPVGFALWAFFAAPLLIPLWHRVSLDSTTTFGSIFSGLLCAVPTLIWRSDYERPHRAGGWLWKVVIRYGIEVSDRSITLFVLAFVGGAAVFMILRTLALNGLKPTAWILGTAIYVSIFITVPVHSALQKYREIPLLACFPILVVAVGGLVIASGVARRRPLRLALAVPAGVQALAAFGTVGFPILQFLANRA